MSEPQGGYTYKGWKNLGPKQAQNQKRAWESMFQAAGEEILPRIAKWGSGQVSVSQKTERRDTGGVRLSLSVEYEFYD